MTAGKGLYPALITPFDKEGRLNTSVLQELVGDLVQKGADGFYVCGSTAESYLLSCAERKRVLEAVMEAAGDKTVIANVGTFATEHGVELARHAEKLGVSAISSVPPFYFPFSMEEYVRYYTDLADAVDVPVVIYNIPAMSAVNFSPADIARLFEDPRIAGVKHTSYDLFACERIVAAHPNKTVFIGHDEIYLSALSIGVRAGIGSTYNIMLEKFQTIARLFEAGSMGEALEVQREVNRVVAALSQVGVFKGVKAILTMQGFDVGVCRKPFLPLSAAELQYLRKTAEEAGIV